MLISSLDILNMEHQYKVNFINSLSGFKSANLVGTIDDQGQHNLSIVSSVFHLGAEPALIGFISRPDSVDRHTLHNIRKTKQFTINSVNQSTYKQAHQTSARYEKHESEFEKTSLTPYLSSLLMAPYVEQSQLRFGLELVEESKIKANNTHLIIGKIKEVFVPTEIIEQDGYINIEKLNTVMVSGLDSYHTSQSLGRLKYAKVK